MKSPVDCFAKVKKDCFKFIKTEKRQRINLEIKKAA